MIAMGTLKIGYVGAGGNTKVRHLPGFAAIAGVEQFAVCNRSFESSKAIADEFGVSEIILNWKDLVQHPEIDAVCIGTWPNMHAEVSIAALEAGKHVLCEARMARSLKEAQKMFDCHQKHPELVFQLVPSPFTFAYDSTMSQIFRKLPYGKLRNASITHTNGTCVSTEANLSWRQDVLISGKNILAMGIFYETWNRWFREDPEWIQAHGDIFTPVRYSDFSQKEENVQIPDAVTILTSYASGARVDYHFGGVSYGPGKTEFILNFEQATVVLDLNANLFKKYTQEEPEGVELAIDESNGGWNVEADFINSIRTNSPVELTSPDQGIQYMKFSELVHQSRRHSAMRMAWSDL